MCFKILEDIYIRIFKMKHLSHAKNDPIRVINVRSSMDDQKLKSLVEESVQAASNSFAKDIADIRSMLMEVMGRTATPTVINSDPTMEVTPATIHRHRPEIGRFCGENPEAWIFQVERYFAFYKTS
uniref:Uncharacterized protein LOC104211658 n=1 Tax=Nicotiana sylvestris TaxID=4096 RepID=A0A1U7VB46_NICSY|nr:PREDICTED: uncharacterized protein LOC104211658 [Nicotiana sylvestris]